MATYNLTQRQKDLLKELVEGVRNQGWSETFMNMSTLSSHALMPMRGGVSIEIEDIDDMNVIAHTDLAVLQYGSRGTARYTLTQAAFDAVDQNFVIPDFPGQGNQYIGVQVHGNVGGSVQGIGYADQAEIAQIVNDPELLKAELEKITSALLDAVKGELHGKQLAEYAGGIESLKETLEVEPQNRSKLRELISKLSFINDTAGTIELMAKAWPYISVLLQLIAQIEPK